MKTSTTFIKLAEIVENIRWPKKGDRLLRKPSDPLKGIDFSPHPASRHVHIWSGYVRAAAALVDECARDSVDRHFLIYPILFNYRHGLELAMKWIIENYGKHAGVSLTEAELNHDLLVLWKRCKQVIIKTGSQGENDEALRVVEQIVKDFHDLDKSSMAFRYSMNKNGATIELPNMSIDLENIKNVMESVENYFTGVDGDLDANISSMGW